MKEGAGVLIGGSRPSDAALAQGAYLHPTLLDTTNRMGIARDEIFGPVGCVIPFDDDHDLLAQIDDNEFALACGVWSRDFPRALRLVRGINAGVAWINTYKATPVNMPFGGNKATGVGREAGLLGMRAYMTQKSVYVSLDESSSAAWPPNR